MKTAFCMPGGGAKGAVELGMISQLAGKGITPDLCVGSSVGGLNSMGMSYLGLKGLCDVWADIKSLSDIWQTNYMPSYWGRYNSKPLRKLIQKHMGKKPVSTYCKAIVPYTDLAEGVTRYTWEQDGDFGKFVEAGAAIPVAVDPIEGRYADAGVMEMAPLKAAIDWGAEHIYILLCNPFRGPETGWKASRSVFPVIDVALRTVDLITHRHLMNDLRYALEKNTDPNPKYRRITFTLLAPTYAALDTTDFDQKSILEGYQAGMNAVEIDLGKL